MRRASSLSPNLLPGCVALLFLALVFAACDVGLSPSGSGSGIGDGTDDGEMCESYPLGEPRDPATLEACCDIGDAHCLPSDVVPDSFADLVEECAGGGSLCIPDRFIETGGTFIPTTCEAITGDGVCLSACVPQVRDVEALLGQGANGECAPDQRCVPCTDPRTGEDTGVCGLRENVCGADVDGDGGGGGGGATCPHDGPPVIDPATFPACGTCSNAACLPNDLVPAEFQARLGQCDATSLCVPNTLVETGGNFIPATCSSVAGGEGRCQSTCLPEVAEQADRLPQDTCAADEKCVPCYDPFTGDPTGSCELSCDPGPTQAPVVLPACCDNRGTCIPGELAGENAEQLGEDTCPADSGLLCAPNDIIDNTFVAASCTTGGLIGGGQDGACLPDCLGAVDSILVGQGDCDDGFKCAPCEGPFGGDTGACDYLP